MPNRNQSYGFVAAGLVILIVVIAAAAGVYIWQRQDDKDIRKSQAGNNATGLTAAKPADSSASWKTYTDSGYPQASGVSIKYPADWRIQVGDSKAYAWQLIQNAKPNASIGVRVVFLDASTTPQNEWENCPSADACGPGPGDTRLDSGSSTINGLESYSVKMRDSTGVYYATVIKGDKPASDGTVPFIEFILANDDPSIVNTYKQIAASANY